MIFHLYLFYLFLSFSLVFKSNIIGYFWSIIISFSDYFCADIVIANVDWTKFLMASIICPYNMLKLNMIFCIFICWITDWFWWIFQWIIIWSIILILVWLYLVIIFSGYLLLVIWFSVCWAIFGYIFILLCIILA